jgi:hypothetical protein
MEGFIFGMRARARICPLHAKHSAGLLRILPRPRAQTRRLADLAAVVRLAALPVIGTLLPLLRARQFIPSIPGQELQATMFRTSRPFAATVIAVRLTLLVTSPNPLDRPLDPIGFIQSYTVDQAIEYAVGAAASQALTALEILSDLTLGGEGDTKDLYDPPSVSLPPITRPQDIAPPPPPGPTMQSSDISASPQDTTPSTPPQGSTTQSSDSSTNPQDTKSSDQNKPKADRNDLNKPNSSPSPDTQGATLGHLP